MDVYIALNTVVHDIVGVAGESQGKGEATSSCGLWEHIEAVVRFDPPAVVRFDPQIYGHGGTISCMEYLVDWREDPSDLRSFQGPQAFLQGRVCV